jgi:BlaI family transcriptional regulator, penicillinase repressor
MEAKGVVQRVKKVGNVYIFAASISRQAAQRRLIDDLLALFGSRSQTVMAHRFESGWLLSEDVKEVERGVKKSAGKEKHS